MFWEIASARKTETQLRPSFDSSVPYGLWAQIEGFHAQNVLVNGGVAQSP